MIKDLNKNIVENSETYARELDSRDPLKRYREKFYIPLINGKESIYFTGNSLGLQPKSTQDYVLNELEDWANYGVEGHFHARNPWLSYHEIFPPLLMEIFGAKEEELVVMNQLTVNLHVLMTSFYQPAGKRFKIICEEKAFPSDQYAFAAQAKLHGFSPEEAIIEVGPREGESISRTEDILQVIKDNADEISLVLFSGVNYYNGQVFDMERITKAAHEAGAYCGFDLAHAAGNIPLHLHDWNVDFACWCSYKYLNSGPGGVAGAFIHERNITKEWLRLAGWWGHDKKSRFKMPGTFQPIPTAEGWQLSNAPVLSMAAHRASLEMFAEAGMPAIFEKAANLHAYARFVIEDIGKTNNNTLEILTPKEKGKHGCQLSLKIKKNGKAIYEDLKKHGVLADWREPDVLRIAPVPLYNSYEDVYRFGKLLSEALKIQA
ncbi:MAG: kynureninase [Ferruginibacter sp.]